MWEREREVISLRVCQQNFNYILGRFQNLQPALSPSQDIWSCPQNSVDLSRLHTPFIWATTDWTRGTQQTWRWPAPWWTTYQLNSLSLEFDFLLSLCWLPSSSSPLDGWSAPGISPGPPSLHYKHSLSMWSSLGPWLEVAPKFLSSPMLQV